MGRPGTSEAGSRLRKWAENVQTGGFVGAFFSFAVAMKSRFGMSDVKGTDILGRFELPSPLVVFLAFLLCMAGMFLRPKIFAVGLNGVAILLASSVIKAHENIVADIQTWALIIACAVSGLGALVGGIMALNESKSETG